MAAEAEATVAGGLAGEMEVEAYRRLFPLAFLERHLRESVRPDARRTAEARPTTVALAAVSSAHGSALVRLGDTAMLASIKLEVMSPSGEAPDEGSVAVEFHMPPICSPLVRPGRPAEVAPVISKTLEDILMSSGILNFKELCLICGKASWLAYWLVHKTESFKANLLNTIAWKLELENAIVNVTCCQIPFANPTKAGEYNHQCIFPTTDVYCLNADGSLFDAALISAVAAFTHLEIPLVSVGDDGRVFTVGGNEGKAKYELVNREKRKLTITNIPFSLTCALHKDNVLADPTAEEESIIETLVTIVLDSSDQIVSIQKPGGAVTSMATIKECISLAKDRRRKLRGILMDSVAAMEVDQTD